MNSMTWGSPRPGPAAPLLKGHDSLPPTGFLQALGSLAISGFLAGYDTLPHRGILKLTGSLEGYGFLALLWLTYQVHPRSRGEIVLCPLPNTASAYSAAVGKPNISLPTNQ